MLPNPKYLNESKEFWANVKLLNQRIGYVRRKSKKRPISGFTIPEPAEIVKKFSEFGIDPSKLVIEDQLTLFGEKIANYMKTRGDMLTKIVEPNLMDQPEAKKLFNKLKKQLKPNCLLPTNKQKGNKKDYAYLTCMVNMLIEKEIGSLQCDYDPRLITTITENNFPKMSLSRRVDGAYPSAINPEAIWEIKEYYYTTTFGSRVADGVYETQLDGWELKEASRELNIEIDHILIIDSHYTWWGMGKSYLCRLVDILHMGLVKEIIFGKEVVTRIPAIAKNWVRNNKSK